MKISIDIEVDHIVSRETRKVSYIAKHGEGTITGRSRIAGPAQRKTYLVVGYGESISEALADMFQKLAEVTRTGSIPPPRTA